MKVIVCLLLAFLTYASAIPIEVQLQDAKAEVAKTGGNIWVVLVAGSDGWYNYRHQADICHAYHIIANKHGIPARYIITMMKNDIAYDEENPNPGVIINALEGQNYYYNIMIDYEAEHVTPEMFLAVLKGDTATTRDKGSGKVVKSTPNDYIFVNFVDHGASGILAFPSGELHKQDLMETLTTMHEGNRYKQMLFYVEACYSGSMFTTLNKDWRITAHTASNDKQSSYACIFDKQLNTYLGDCWSLNWMNNTDKIFPHLESETIMQQYLIVKKATTQSIASLYGDLTTIPSEPLSTFMGHPIKEDVSNGEVIYGDFNKDAIQSQDVMLYIMRKKLEQTNSFFEREELVKKISYHENTEQRIKEKVDKIVKDVVGDDSLFRYFIEEVMDITELECNKKVMSAMFDACYWRIQTHPYITKYLQPLANLCNGYSTEDILVSIATNCNEN